MASENSLRRRRHKCFSSLFSLFRLLLFFASVNQQFIVASHNLHSFKKSSIFHKQCIQNRGGIWLSQELWLPENRLTELSNLGVQYVAQSGMEDAMSRGIYAGRPHGGVAIAWSPDFDHVIKPLVNYRHKRVVCVEMNAEPDPLLFASVYMPFFDASKRLECIAATNETIAMLEEILSDHPRHKVIIGGDFNTEFKGSSPFDTLWREFIRKHHLVCCDQYNNNNNNNCS